MCVCSGESDRDIFNEKPSKEEQLSATQVCVCERDLCACELVGGSVGKDGVRKRGREKKGGRGEKGRGRGEREEGRERGEKGERG